MNLCHWGRNASLSLGMPRAGRPAQVKSDGAGPPRVYDLWIMAAAVSGIVAFLLVRRYQDERA